LIQGWERGIVGLRTLTPFGFGKYLRASLYNGVSEQQAEVLATFMADFLKTSRAKHSAA
jgi:phosphoserine aminotransferase